MIQLTQSQSTAAQRRIPFLLELSGECQQVNLGDIGVGDSFTMTYSGQTSASVNQASDMSAAMDTALENLSNIAAGDITVVRISASVYNVIFGGTLAGTDAALLTLTPTGFTPTGVSVIQTEGDPATGLTLTAAADIQISKNGGTQAAAGGSVTEVGDGLYYYEATAAELDTLGFFSGVVLRNDVQVTTFAAQVVGSSTELGSPVIRSNTAQAGATGTITLDASASSVNNFYNHAIVYLRSGTGSGQARQVYTYNGTTKVASVDPDWTTVPDNTSVFDILPAPPIAWDILRSHHTTVDSYGDVATDTELVTATKEAIIGQASTTMVVDDNGQVTATLGTRRTT